MQAIAIKQSQLKMLLGLVGSGSVPPVVLFVTGGNILVYFATGALGLTAIIFVIRLLWPSVLTLNHKGFSISGGLFNNQDFEYWENVSEFYLRDALPLSRFYAPIITFDKINGVSGGIVNAWPYSQTNLIALLNEYRSNALALPY